MRSRHQPFAAKALFLLLTLPLQLLATTELDVRQWYDEVDRLNPITRDALNAAERQRLLRLTSHHKVASLDALSKYDTTGEVGFCFGRAMTAHLIARKLGLNPNGIRKLFIIGDLRSGPDPEWRFHVTTLVKGEEDGRWYAIDPIMLPPMAPGTPLFAQRWIDIVQSVWDRPKKAHFYFAERHAVMPDARIFPTTLADETGEMAVELSFDPIGKPGFQHFAFDVTPIFQLDRTAEHQHFLGALEPDLPGAFSFLKLSMTLVTNGKKTDVSYDFNGYFADLLEDLKKNELEAWENEAVSRRGTRAHAMGPWVPNLHSLRVHQP